MTNHPLKGLVNLIYLQKRKKEEVKEQSLKKVNSSITNIHTLFVWTTYVNNFLWSNHLMNINGWMIVPIFSTLHCIIEVTQMGQNLKKNKKNSPISNIN